MKKYLRCLLALGLLASCSIEKNDSEIVSPLAEQIPEDNQQIEDVQEIKLEDIVSFDRYNFNLSEEQTKSFDEKSCTISVPKILSDKPEATKFNKNMKELYDYAMNSTVYEEETLYTAHFIWNETYINENVVSMVIYQQPMQWQAGKAPETIEIYNYDLKNDHFLENEEILTTLNFNIDSLEEKLSNILTSSYFTSENVPSSEFGIPNTDALYLYETEYDKNIQDKIVHHISNQDKIYIKDNSCHIILQGAEGMIHRNFDIEILEE